MRQTARVVVKGVGVVKVGVKIDIGVVVKIGVGIVVKVGV
jgi:hypothetical protein